MDYSSGNLLLTLNLRLCKPSPEHVQCQTVSMICTILPLTSLTHQRWWMLFKETRLHLILPGNNPEHTTNVSTELDEHHFSTYNIYSVPLNYEQLTLDNTDSNMYGNSNKEMSTIISNFTPPQLMHHSPNGPNILNKVNKVTVP